jgi:hypothetical protein
MAAVVAWAVAVAMGIDAEAVVMVGGRGILERKKGRKKKPILESMGSEKGISPPLKHPKIITPDWGRWLGQSGETMENVIGII